MVGPRVSTDLYDESVTDKAEALAICKNFVDQHKDPINAGTIKILPNPDFFINDVQPGHQLYTQYHSQWFDKQNLDVSRVRYSHDGLVCDLGYTKSRLSLTIRDQQKRLNQIENQGITGEADS